MAGVKLCTQLQGGTWQTYLHAELTPKEVGRLNAMPPLKLLNAVQLKQAVGANRVQKLLNRVKPILPEIDLNGNRRCIYIKEDGVRCQGYNEPGMCKEHMSKVTTITPHFRNQTLQQQYDKYLRDPKKMHLDRELAMLRLMMQKLMDSITGENIPVMTIQHMTVLTRDIKAMVEACTKMNQLTPETVDNILGEVVKILAKFVPADKLEDAAAELEKLTMSDPISEVPLDPGTLIEVDGQVQEIEVEDPKAIQRRALLERYGNELGEEERKTLESML